MRKLPVYFFFLLLCAVFLLAADVSKIPPMPTPVSGNAVASLRNGIELYSLMGIGPKKTWNDVTNKVYILRLASPKWQEGRTVPGVAGRLGASAIGAKLKIFLFGGYVIDGRGNETIVGDANAYLPDEHRWYRAEDIPIPVDRAVIGVNHDRFIYLVGGRSKAGPINNVQVYDVEKGEWSQATPFPGTPVFGHAGGLADDAIVLIDGAKKNTAAAPPYVSSDECWIGKIDHKDANKIEWSKLPTHPGIGRFGIVAGVDGRKILFSGGTKTPHDFRGLGYDGRPSELSATTFVLDVRNRTWDTVTDEATDVRTDAGAIVNTPIGALILGGMTADQEISDRVVAVPKK